MSFAVPTTGDECKGTLSHMAPELLYPEGFGLCGFRVSKQADIYALGMVFYEVLTGRPPFGAERRRNPEIMLCVIQGERPIKPENAGDIGFGGGMWELVQQCWHQEREERPTVEKTSKHLRRAARTSLIVLPCLQGFWDRKLSRLNEHRNICAFVWPCCYRR
jgi:serine/threonine protein kinase